MIEIKGIRVSVMESVTQLEKQIQKKLKLNHVLEYIILRRSIDARKKNDIHYVYQVGVFSKDEKKILKKVNDKNVMLTKRTYYHFPQSGTSVMKHHPIIVGAGPAGLFCGLLLAKMGYEPVIVERGLPVEERMAVVDAFWKDGSLNPECNVQFGEGGAGTFSDGKLNTQVKDKFGRIRYVLEKFVQYGATEEILYDNKPHVGTDLLVNIVKGIREEIESLGGVFLFDTKVTDVIIENNCIQSVHLLHKGFEKVVDTNLVVLAIGHSARDTFEMLYNKNLSMESKDFAMGVRVEHPASMIQTVMYGNGQEADILPAAPYKVTHQTEQGRGVYSFCMCPGGYVVNASSEEGCTAVNGMSYSGRNGVNSNSAIVVTVRRQDFNNDHPLAGIEFQRKLEHNIYEQGGGKVVVQRFEDFELGQATKQLGEISPQIKGEYVLGNVASCLPSFMAEAITEGMHAFEHQIPGFSHPDTVLSGIESRTSSPVRIHRDATFQSNVQGLYPCGEGAGYAGGIMSAAMDGMKVAEAIIKEYAPFD
ncbi:MAG: FAD-dependent oxidoreductase [Lachnospiraceae bacterium]|nr:FAD-dependent oxidoreductase [Lachnospiraceae bacterium]